MTATIAEALLEQPAISRKMLITSSKAAVDYAVGMKTGTIKNIVIKIGGKETPQSSSPYSAFGKAVDELGQLKSFMRLPSSGRPSCGRVHNRSTRNR